MHRLGMTHDPLLVFGNYMYCLVMSLAVNVFTVKDNLNSGR